jgi:uncharacterized protein
VPITGDVWPAAAALGTVPADLPPHWMVYFAVANADATATRAVELGGTVQVPPSDVPQGRYAVLCDPQGARFSVIKLNSTR